MTSTSPFVMRSNPFLRSVFTKTMYDRRRSLAGWSAGVGLTVAGILALWPAVRDLPGLSEVLAGYPEAMKELFGVELLTTPAGYLHGELFSILAPLMFVVFAVALGARLIAGEEEQGTLEVLLVANRSRARILFEKAAALAASVAVLGVVLFTTLAFGAAALQMDIALAHLAAASVNMTLLGVQFGLLALAVGAACGHRYLAIGTASAVGVAAYLLYAFGSLVSWLEPWRALSPFYQALGSDPLLSGLSAGHAAASAVVGLVVLLACLPGFLQRDIAT